MQGWADYLDGLCSRKNVVNIRSNRWARLLDHYSQFRRAFHTCKHCGWHGKGTSFTNGTYNCLGINKHCPECGEPHCFAKFSVLVEDDCPDDWPPIKAD